MKLIADARSMPMSASCVINRGDVLTAIDDIIDHLPDEIAQAQEVIDESQAKVSEGEAEAGKLVAVAREQVAELAEDTEIVRAAKERAAELIAEAEDEAAALRRETDSSSTPGWPASSRCCTRPAARCGPHAPASRSARGWTPTCSRTGPPTRPFR